MPVRYRFLLCLLKVKVPPEAKQFAKLTQPQMSGLLNRFRLFKVFEDVARHPAMWIAGPPGSGKTTLVATHLECSQRPAIWYDLDNCDDDPASFFYYLQIAAGDSSLPRFEPDHSADIKRFSRKFFQSLFAAIPASGVVVFDNYHELGADSPLHAIFDIAVATVPEGRQLVITSRGEPPATLARHVANSRFGRIDWNDLRLTVEETIEVLRARGETTPETATAIHVKSDGWAAGIVLMAARARRTGAIDHVDQKASMANVFDYFANQVFADLPQETQDLLLETSMLSGLSANLAATLTGNPQAGRILELLCQHHLFTERRIGDDTAYRYHALFREYLQQRAMAAIAPERWNARLCRAAGLLEKCGDAEGAFELYVRAEAWVEAGALVVRHAPGMLNEGRAHLVTEWLAALPVSIVDAQPWLRYWGGCALLEVDQPKAETWLEPAFNTFEAAGDKIGQLLSAAMIAESHYFEMLDYKQLDRWVQVLASMAGEVPRLPDRELQARVYAAMVITLMIRQPANPQLAVVAGELSALLEQDMGDIARISAGGLLLNYFAMTRQQARLDHLVTVLNHVAQRPGLPPRRRIVWLLQYSVWLQRSAKADEAMQLLRELEMQVDEHGFTGTLIQFTLLLNKLRCEMALDLDDAAVATLRKAEGCLTRPTRMVSFYLNYYKAILALRAGQPDAAHTAASLALDLAEAVGAPGLQQPRLMEVAASALAQMGKLAEAAAMLDQAVACASGEAAPDLEASSSALKLLRDLQERNAQDRRSILDKAIGKLREQRAFSFLPHLPDIVSELASQALWHGVEETYVCELISRRNLKTQHLELPNWPWHAKVYTLRPFEVQVRGSPVGFGRKAQKKPLDLLKVIIALGGQAVDSQRIIDILWPDAASDGHKSLESTLARLRKILERDDAILVQEGKLTLNRRCVWVDVWAFEEIFVRVEPTMSNLDADSTKRAMLACDLYKAPFLGAEQKTAWIQPTADRLQHVFHKLVLGLGANLEQASQWPAAAEIYDRGLAVDNLSEPLYRHLMSCHAQMNELAQALGVYRRCRDNLSIVLGIAPSDETRRLHDSIRNRLG